MFKKRECLVGFDMLAQVENFTGTLQQCYKKFKKLDLVFDYDAVHIITRKVPGDVQNRKNWEIYQQKELFATSEFVKVFRSGEYTAFISLGFTDLASVKSISWKGWDLAQQISKAVWFKGLSSDRIIIKKLGDKFIIQKFIKELLVQSRVVDSDYLELEVDEGCDVVLLDDYEGLPDAKRFSLSEKQDRYLLYARRHVGLLVGLYACLMTAVAFSFNYTDASQSIFSLTTQNQQMHSKIQSLTGIQQMHSSQDQKAKSNEKIVSFVKENANIIQLLEPNKVCFDIKAAKSYAEFAKNSRSLHDKCRQLGKAEPDGDVLTVGNRQKYRFRISS